MRNALILPFVAALPLAALASPAGFEISENSTTLVTRQMSSTACPKKGIHIIAAPGSGGTGPDDYGYLSSTVVKLQHAIPGSNNFCLGPYQDPSNGLIETENAEHQARAHLHDFHNACPHTPILFLGYSAGAIGSMNLLCGSSPSPPWRHTKIVKRAKKNIFGLVTFGDETHKKGMPYNRGSCKNNAPMYPRTTSKGCKPFWPNIRSFCDKEDGDCCAGGVDGGPAHFAYPMKYNGRVVHFAKHALKEFHKKNKKHH